MISEQCQYESVILPKLKKITHWLTYAIYTKNPLYMRRKLLQIKH